MTFNSTPQLGPAEISKRTPQKRSADPEHQLLHSGFKPNRARTADISGKPRRKLAVATRQIKKEKLTGDARHLYNILEVEIDGRYLVTTI